MSARLLLDPRFWTSASGFHPEFHWRSRRCQDRDCGFQTAEPRCFSRKQVTRSRQAVVYYGKGENRSQRSERADSPRLITAIDMPPVFFVQQQQHAPPSAFPALPDSLAPRCTDSPQRRERHVLLHTRQVRAGAAATEGIPPELRRSASTAKCVRHRRSP